MATVITESTTYATTVTAPDDADSLNAASVTAAGVGFQALTDRTNNLVRRSGGANGAGEFQYLDATGAQTPRARTRIISPIDWAHGTLQVIATGQYFTLAGFTNSFSLTSQQDRVRIACDVSKLLDVGATLTGVEVLVVPGAARGTVGDRMFLDVSSSTPDFSTPAAPPSTQLANVTDDGTFNAQVVSSGALTEVVSRAKQIIVLVRCGIDAGTNKDTIHSVRLSFDAIGPNAF